MLLPLYGGGFFACWMQLAAYYYITSAALHYVGPAFLPVKHIQKAPRPHGEVLRDAVSSLGPITVKALIWTVVEVMHRRGWGLLYAGRIDSVPKVAYALVCVVVLDYLHDAWFYWTHRLLHWRPLYKHIHAIHHRSKTPSAFTGYSFHVIEAVIVFANEIFVCFLFPIHMGLHRLYHLHTTLIHEGGHAGYEIAPFIPSIEQVGLMLTGTRSKLSSALNTVQHHDLHHRFPTTNFSLYFTHWDRLMGTLYHKYDAELFSYY